MSLRLSPLVGFPYFLRVLLGRPMLHLVHWGQFPQLLEIVQLQQLFGSNPFLRVGDQHPHQGCHKVVCEEREPAVGHLCADVDRWELVRVASQLVHEAHILEASQSVFVHKLDDGTTAYETGDGLESVSLALEREGFAVSEEGEHNDGETPNIGRGCYVSRPEEQLGRIKTGGALAEIGVVPWEVKAGEIPINQLHFSELVPCFPNNIHEDVAKLEIVVDDPCLMSLQYFLDDLKEDQPPVFRIELHCPQHN